MAGIASDNTMIQTVSGETFTARVLQYSGPIAVEFMSYGCVHCRLMEPVLQQAAHDLAATVAVVRVNVAVDQDLANRYGVEGTPTLIMFRAGHEAGRAEGPKPELASVMNTIKQPFA